MKVRTRTVLWATAWLVSLAVTGAWAQTERAFITQAPPVTINSEVITAPNIGFRPDSTAGSGAGTIAGDWVVRVGGEWRVAVSPVRARPVIGK